MKYSLKIQEIAIVPSMFEIAIGSVMESYRGIVVPDELSNFFDGNQVHNIALPWPTKVQAKINKKTVTLKIINN